MGFLFWQMKAGVADESTILDNRGGQGNPDGRRAHVTLGCDRGVESCDASPFTA